MSEERKEVVTYFSHDFEAVDSIIVDVYMHVIQITRGQQIRVVLTPSGCVARFRKL